MTDNLSHTLILLLYASGTALMVNAGERLDRAKCEAAGQAWIIATDSGPQLVLGDASVPGMPPIVFSRFLVPTDTAGRLAAMLAEAVKQIRQGNNKSGVLN